MGSEMCIRDRRERESNILVGKYCEISRDIKFFVNSRGEGICRAHLFLYQSCFEGVRGEGESVSPMTRPKSAQLGQQSQQKADAAF